MTHKPLSGLPSGFLLAALAVLSVAASGCAIKREVRPVDASHRIQTIFIAENQRVHMEGFLPEMVTQLQDMGYVTETYLGTPPRGARYTMTYTANWAWDLAMYLTYFRVELFDRGRPIAEAEYDARGGSAHLGKFGTTAEKIRPLLEEMLGETPPS